MIFGSTVTMPGLPSFSFGFSKPNDPPIPSPVFNNTGSPSILNRSSFDISPQEFTFGAMQTQKPNDAGFNTNTNIPTVNDISMDGSWSSDNTFLWKELLMKGKACCPLWVLHWDTGIQSGKKCCWYSVLKLSSDELNYLTTQLVRVPEHIRLKFVVSFMVMKFESFLCCLKN